MTMSLTPAVGFRLFLVSLAVLAVYCVTMGYHSDALLMGFVAVVRLATGYGLGAGIGVVVAIGMLLMRRQGVFSSLVTTTLVSGALIVVMLALYNLAVAL